MATTNNSLDIPQGDGQILIGSTGVAPVANTLTQGTGISIINGPGTITINSTNSNFTWNTVSGSITMAPNNGYSSTVSGPITLTLPIKGTYSIGDVFRATYLQGLYSILTSASQEIYFNGLLGSTSLTATSTYGSAVEIICTQVSATDTFVVTSYSGTFSLL